jgi:hypothetical protein
LSHICYIYCNTKREIKLCIGYISITTHHHLSYHSFVTMADSTTCEIRDEIARIRGNVQVATCRKYVILFVMKLIVTEREWTKSTHNTPEEIFLRYKVKEHEMNIRWAIQDYRLAIKHKLTPRLFHGEVERLSEHRQKESRAFVNAAPREYIRIDIELQSKARADQM